MKENWRVFVFIVFTFFAEYVAVSVESRLRYCALRLAVADSAKHARSETNSCGPQNRLPMRLKEERM